MAIQPIKPDAGLGLWGTVATQWGFEAANQSWIAGALLGTDNSGHLTVLTNAATYTSSTNNNLSVGYIMGVALANSYNINTNTVPVANTALYGSPSNGYDPYVLCNPDIMTFTVTVDSTLSSNNAPLTGKLAATGLYQFYSLQKDNASGNWCLITNTATNNAYSANAVCMVTDFIDAPNTINGRVRIRFLRTQLVSG